MPEVTLAKEKQMDLFRLLEALESSTDLEGTALVTKTGVRIVSSTHASVDIDAHSASPATITSLGEKIANGLNYGQLQQVVVTGQGGYTIITTNSNSEFVLLSHCKKAAKLGYYFHRLQKAFEKMISILKDIKIESAQY